MSTLTIGKLRGLRQITTPEGLVIILALDHRNSLFKLLGIKEGAPGFYDTLSSFKRLILAELLPYASAALLDPQYSAADAISSGALPGSKGLIVALERSGYMGDSTARRTEVLPGWSVAKAKRMGASAAKLLVDYNTGAGRFAELQEEMVAGIVEEARRADLALILEPVTYSIDPAMPKDSAGFAAERPALIAETARRMGALGPDMLKLEFPYDARHDQDEAAWDDACRSLTEISPVPWAVLSAGVSYETFKRQVRVACAAGASGYVAGRSFWQDVVRQPPEDRQPFLRNVAALRMTETAEIARLHARPWTAAYAGLATAGGEGWYTRYEA
jgi:tagatose-1,6-bisphosphate aldolase